MSNWDVDINGYEHVIRELRKLGDIGEKALKDALKEGAEVVADEAKHVVHVKTGKLKDSIRVLPPKYDSAGVLYTYVKQGNNKAWYGHLHHNGHINEEGNYVSPNPFMRTALERKNKEAIQKVADVMFERMGL